MNPITRKAESVVAMTKAATENVTTVPLQDKKKGGQQILLSAFVLFFARCPNRYLFSRMDSLRGANTCTCAAFRASLGVDGILVAFGDSSYRAFIDASTACDAVVTNYVSHFVLSFNCC